MENFFGLLYSQLATLAVVGVTLYTSLRAAKDPVYFNFLLFKVGRVRFEKEYYRLLSSALVHLNWLHLAINLVIFYMFASELEAAYGWFVLLPVYVVSVAGGSLLDLWFYRDRPEYSAGGASGGVVGVIFASIFLFPKMKLGLLLIPIGIPGWLFALAYVALSIYAAKREMGIFGYMAHVGGGISGALLAPIINLAAVLENWLAYLALMIGMLAFLIYESKYSGKIGPGGQGSFNFDWKSFFRRRPAARGKVIQMPRKSDDWQESYRRSRENHPENEDD